ncbi:MAG: tetratricopeptide repeat protein [Planctomycetota bacterium]
MPRTGKIIATLAAIAFFSAGAETARSFGGTDAGKVSSPPPRSVSDTRSRTSAAPSSRTTADIHAALESGRPREALEMLNSRTTDLRPVEKHSLEGRAYYLSGDLRQARHKLKAAVDERPKHAEDLYWLGRTYAKSNSPTLAATYYQRASWSGLDTADLHYDWAVALKEAGQLLGNISRRPQPGEEDQRLTCGGFVREGLVIGEVPSQQGWVIVSPVNSAIYQVHRALALEPEQPEALLLSGEVWLAVKREKEAALAFARAFERLSKAEDLSRCHAGWAASLLALGDVAGYLKHARKGMQALGAVDSTAMAACFASAAGAMARRGDLPKQIRYLTLSVELWPRVDRLIELADALVMAQRTHEANQYLKKALAQNPSAQERREIRQRLPRGSRLTPSTP